MISDLSIEALLRLPWHKGDVENTARGYMMAWARNAMKLISDSAWGYNAPLTRIAVPAFNAVAEGREPVTAVEMRTLFAGDLQSADRSMTVSYG